MKNGCWSVSLNYSYRCVTKRECVLKLKPRLQLTRTWQQTTDMFGMINGRYISQILYDSAALTVATNLSQILLATSSMLACNKHQTPRTCLKLAGDATSPSATCFETSRIWLQWNLESSKLTTSSRSLELVFRELLCSGFLRKLNNPYPTNMNCDTNIRTSELVALPSADSRAITAQISVKSHTGILHWPSSVMRLHETHSN